LTAGHLRKLKTFSNKVLLTFDADPAGISAAKRVIDLVYAEGLISKIVLLSEGEDPDTFLRKYGAEKFKNFLAKALSPVRFFLSRAGKSKIDGVRQFLTILSSCHDPLLRDDALRELSDLASEKVLREELAIIAGKTSRANRQLGISVPEQSAPSSSGAMTKEEEILLNIAFSLPRMARRIAERVDVANLENPLAKNLFEKILAFPQDDTLSIDNFLKDCSQEERTLISKLSIDPGIDMNEIARNVDDCINRIRLKSINKRISVAKSIGDADSLRTLLRERTILIQKPVELFQSKNTQ
jgi:DNA primase